MNAIHARSQLRYWPTLRIIHITHHQRTGQRSRSIRPPSADRNGAVRPAAKLGILRPDGKAVIYLKSAVAGIIGAVAAVAIWLIAEFVSPIVLALVFSRVTGAGGIGAVSSGTLTIFTVALLGFLAGFVWQFRRSSSRSQRPW